MPMQSLNLLQIPIMIKSNFKSVVVASIIFYLSITESSNLKAPRFFDIPNIDKIVHFAMYFTFMFVLVYEHRFSFEKKRNAFLISLIPFLYGILMEICQGLLTKSRSADIFDVMFNTLGILAAAALWKYLIHLQKERLN
jgi:VanZ family protein